jgi:hypothetical protein
MGTEPEVLRLVGEVTERYGSLEAFFTRLRAEFDDQPTMQLPVIDPAAGGPMAWSAVAPAPAAVEKPSPATEVATPPAQYDEDHRDESADELEDARVPAALAPTPPRGAAGMWGRLTGRMR